MEDLKEIIKMNFKTSNYNFTKIIDSDHKIKWIPIISCWPNKYLGISENGNWVVEEGSGLRILDTPYSFLRIKVFLERPLDDIRSEINKALNIHNISTSFDSIFPYIEIIYQVINNDTDYWVDLAFKWYDKLPDKQKFSFKLLFEQISNKKTLSQKIRQKAKNELKQLRYEVFK